MATKKATKATAHKATEIGQEIEPPLGFESHPDVRWYLVPIPLSTEPIPTEHIPRQVQFRPTSGEPAELVRRLFFALRRLNVELKPNQPINSNAMTLSWIFELFAGVVNGQNQENQLNDVNHGKRSDA